MNVWLALTHDRHAHHEVARGWFELQNDCRFYFCRFTQLGFLRLLTNPQVMGAEALSMRAAWKAYAAWLRDSRVRFHPEPDNGDLERLFQTFTSGSGKSTKVWADGYLGAFAAAAGLTLVSFDPAVASLRAVDVLVLPAPQ